MGDIKYLGEQKDDNTLVPPSRLMEMVQEEIDRAPVKGLHVIIIREDDDGLHTETFRCGLDRYIEEAIIARTYFKCVQRP
jgi:hypothetical protein